MVIDMSQETKLIYSLDEVQSILQVTRRTLYTYIKSGKLKAVKIGKYWRVPSDALQQLISTGDCSKQ